MASNKQTTEEEHACLLQKKEQQDVFQSDLLLIWCQELLQSKRNINRDEQHDQNMRRWYDVFKNGNGDMRSLENLFVDHVKTVVGLNLTALSILESLLHSPGSQTMIVIISMYAEEKVCLPNQYQFSWFQQLGEKYEYLQKCNKNWWESACWGHRMIRHVLQDVLNQSDSFSRHLAQYSNDVLSFQTHMSSFDTNRGMDRIVLFYSNIQLRDVFERHYQLYFAVRLLNNVSKSLTLEQKMIDLLRKEVSAYACSWTNELQVMLNDIQKPLFTMVTMSTTPQMNINFCSSSYWPCTTTPPFYIPRDPDLENLMNQCKRQFMQQFPDRKFMWHMDKGRADVSVSITDKIRYVFNVTTYQMMILLVFNESRRVTFQQILEVTGVPTSEISHHLLSLVHPKVAILLKRPNTRLLEANHQFMVNPRYTNSKKKVLVHLCSLLLPTKTKI